LLQEHLRDLLGQVTLLPAPNAPDDTDLASVAWALRESGAERVFLCAFDEIASGCWRRAAFGILPPAHLHGRIGGIYHRPRFMAASRWSVDRFLKARGLRRLVGRRWIAPLLFPDEFLARGVREQFPHAPIHFLPDPCPEGFDGDAAVARARLELPADKRVLLFFGTGARRKGLHLAVEAMLNLPPDSRAFLLCAGRLNPEGATASGLEKLGRQGRARVLNRYVSAEEEKLCFTAAHAVLLPYVNHFGTSGVLSRAAAAGKMVIVSNEQLIGRLTRERKLGLLFASGDARELRECLCQAAAMSEEQLCGWRDAARAYARAYSRAAYRAVVLGSLGALEGGHHE
ncbi:MAG TPA: glycosyltransferase, partial [Clostridia bacterium]|nr:glycosyltransferase [Clostridia bacterium]